MRFARIVLSNTNYHLVDFAKILVRPNIAELQKIYKKYCEYKQFASVMPLFDSQFSDKMKDIIGYYDNNQLVAFSIIHKHDRENVEAVQFAWNYQNPELRLGILSLEHECAFYKNLGYKYLYLGYADAYKEKFDGYEILGNN